MPDRMGLILLVENLDQYEAAVKSVKGANDKVASSMGAVEVKSKTADKGLLSLAGAFAVGNVAAMAFTKVITATVGSIKKLITEVTMATAKYKVMDAALDASATQAGYAKAEIDELQMAIHNKGVTYTAATDLVLTLIDAEADLGKALELVTTAQNAASRAGGSTSDNIMRMLYAMQTANPVLLRSMYLTADFAGAEEEFAESLGKTRDALSDSEAMTARMNAIIEAGAPLMGAYEAAMGEGAKVAGSLKDRIKDIKTVVGEITYPAWSEMIQAAYARAKELLAYLEDNRETLEEMGKALASGVKAAITQVELLVGEIAKIPGAVETAGVSLAALFVGFEEAEERSSKLGKTAGETFALLAGGVAWSVSMFKSLTAAIGETAEAMLPLRDTIRLLRGEIDISEWARRADEDLAGLKEAWDFDEAVDKAGQAFDDAVIKVGEFTGVLEKDVPEAAEEAASAVKEAGEEIVEATEDQIKAAEALADLRLDLQRELADDLIDAERDLLREEIDLAREREDIARQTATAIADAYAAAEEDRAALTLDAAAERTEYEAEATEEWLDMQQEAADDREQLDLDHARRREDIETDLVRRLLDIQQQFDMDVQDAARTRDAFALVQAQRRAAAETDEAKETRDEQLADADTAYQRQMDDYKTALDQQRQDLQESLAAQEADLEQSLVEQQQAIEDQLQEQLLAIEEANRIAEEERARQMTREQEDAALQAQWEQEDRTRRLARQLEDMEVQYGDIGDVTAEGLQEQVQEWADTYGPEGAATRIITEWADIVEVQLTRVMADLEETADATGRLTQSLDELEAGKWDINVAIPPELELQSPKTALQVGMEKLNEMMRQPMPFLAGGLPVPAVSRSETYSRSEKTHDVNINAPDNLDIVVQRQMVGTLKQVLPS